MKVQHSLCNKELDNGSLQHTATHCIHYTATDCNTLQRTAYITLQHTATHCNTTYPWVAAPSPYRSANKNEESSHGSLAKVQRGSYNKVLD